VKFVTISQLNDPEAKPIDDESEEYLAQLTLADVHLSAPHNLLPSREFTLFSSPEGGLVWVPFSESVVRIIAPIPFSETPPKVPSVEYLNDIVEKRGIPGGPKIDRVIWGARFRIRSCLAQEFVIPYSTNSENGHGAILLAGDAAHVHSPAGGQGMNLGIRDGILLGDVIASELASSSKGASVSARLIEFGKERQRIAAEVIKMTEWMTWAAVNTGTGWRRLVRNSLVRPLGWFGFVRRRIALQMSGINF
jgi:2-polyprenyl-6-methoxyphenol hydroxylase-like FAD-dependent oxidoreductase